MNPTAAIASSSSPDLPPIDPELVRWLEADVLERGVLIPIVVAEDGTILDSRLRAEIAAKHRLALPKIVVAKLNTRERAELRTNLNVLRRHLTRQQIRDLLAWEIRRTPDASDRAIAGRVGCSPTTVGKARAGVQIGHLRTRTGKDGKKYPSRPKPVVTTLNEAQAAEAARLLGTLRDVPDRPLSVGKLRSLEHQERRQREAEGPHGRLPASITIRHADLRKFDWSPWAGRASLVCVDPPWAKEYAHLRRPLIDLCGRLLREGGVLCLYTGQHHLGNWIAELGDVLAYRWIIASVNEGSPRILHNGRNRTAIYSGWRPILVASKGDLTNNRLFHDVLRHGQEKTHHPWQQPADEARRLIEIFSKEGDCIIDPCCGSGSTLLGVLQAGGGRVGVGVDVDAKAVQIAKKRVAEALVVAEGA